MPSISQQKEVLKVTVTTKNGVSKSGPVFPQQINLPLIESGIKSGR